MSCWTEEDDEHRFVAVLNGTRVLVEVEVGSDHRDPQLKQAVMKVREKEEIRV
jgi:hypothetical protein